MTAPVAPSVIDWRAKGFPPDADGVAVDSFVAGHPPLFAAGFTWPLMVLRRSALDHNITGFAAYCRAHGVSLSPHIKTTMSPELWQEQLDAGAWALTVATPHQLRVLRTHGVSRLFLANELVDPVVAHWAAHQLQQDESFEMICYVDSVAGVHLLGEATRGTGDRRLRVVVELGSPGGRTGCRTSGEAHEVAAAVRQEPSLALVGVAGYEGVLGHDRTAGTLASVRAFVGLLRSTLEGLDELDLLDPDGGEYLASCGGSSFFDVVVDGLGAGWRTRLPVRTVLRSGAYVTHDSRFYAEVSPSLGADRAARLRPAIEIWGEVLSRPEPSLAIVGIGKRDTSTDEGLPVVLAVRRRGADAAVQALPGCTVERLNDQHAYVTLAGDPSGPPLADRLPVGSLICLGISHPCTTHDRWQLAPVVDDDYRVVGVAHSYF